MIMENSLEKKRHAAVANALILGGVDAEECKQQGRFEATHEFPVEARVADVFPLFLPDGESRWEPSWNPMPVVPDVIRAEKNAVFVTDTDENQKVWTIVNFDPDRFTIEYLVLDANFQQRWITVRCRELRPGKSNVSVSYVTTALSNEGLENVRRYDVDFIKRWEGPVREAVGGPR
jgi:hypothetical protein